MSRKLSKAKRAEIEAAVNTFRLTNVDGTHFIHLDVPRGVHKGFYFLLVLDSLTAGQESTVDRLRESGYAVGVYSVLDDVRVLIGDYLKGRKWE